MWKRVVRIGAAGVLLALVGSISSGTQTRPSTLSVYYEVYGLPGGEEARFSTSYQIIKEMPDGTLTAVASRSSSTTARARPRDGRSP